VHEDNAPVVSVQFSPNGKFLLAWTLDGCIRLWDYVEGLCKKTYQGHENKKYSIGGAFGVCGNEAFIVSGSENGDIVIWDVKSKNILQKVGAHTGVVSWVDTHPSLDVIASCGLDGMIKIWSNDEDKDDHEEDVKMEGVEDMDYDTPREPSSVDAEILTEL
jgi:COMPASS component SWD3